MSFAGLLRQPVTILTPDTITDAYNNEVRDWTDPAERSLRVYLEQTDQAEVTVDRETYTTNWLMVAPAAAALEPWERVVYGDRTLEVIGPAREAFNPRLGAVHHVEARLREVTG